MAKRGLLLLLASAGKSPGWSSTLTNPFHQLLVANFHIVVAN